MKQRKITHRERDTEGDKDKGRGSNRRGERGEMTREEANLGISCVWESENTTKEVGYGAKNIPLFQSKIPASPVPSSKNLTNKINR